MEFDWNPYKAITNLIKHGVDFYDAQKAFIDPKRIIKPDMEHSGKEPRFYCFGKVNDRILTVRFTKRKNVIRLIGAGYWRKGKKIYEKENKI